MPTVRRGDKELHVESWGGFVEQQIREAQARGDFDNLPGAGKPLDLQDDNPFNPEWSSAFRVAKNAGAAPLWVELDKEVGAGLTSLAEMLDRTARYLARERERIERTAAGPAAPDLSPVAAAPTTGVLERRPARRWWPFGRRPTAPAEVREIAPAGPLTLADLERERLRARGLYLDHAADLDKTIVEFNTQRPRNLTWIEKPRLLPAEAAHRFDTACPPIGREAVG